MKTLLQLFALILISNTVLTQQIIHRIASPSTSTGELAFDGENIWMASPGDNSLYNLSPSDGSVIGIIEVDTDPRGLTYDGTALWVADRSNRILQQIDPKNEVIMQQFDLDNFRSAGLAWDNGNLWLANNQQNTTIGDSIYYISSTTGNIINSRTPFGTQPAGLAFDGTYLYQTDNDDDVVYKIDPESFMVVETFPTPGGEFANGLTFDGTYLWVSNNDSDSLYQMDIGFIPSSITEKPFSSNAISVFPNPSSGIFTFNTELKSGNEPFLVRVYNPLGQKILQKSFNSNAAEINLVDHGSNIYFFTVSNKSTIIASGNLVKK